MCLIRAFTIGVPVAQLVECVTHVQRTWIAAAVQASSLICGHVLDVTPLSLIPCPVISKSHVNKKRQKKGYISMKYPELITYIIVTDVQKFSKYYGKYAK